MGAAGTEGAVEVGGRLVAYSRVGDGPPVVLLHGAVCDGRVWRSVAELLADEFTVVAWDAPGCGRSDDPPPSFGLSDYADCAAGFVAALELERPHVIGHSFGGGLAIELLHRHPRLARSLVLAATYAGWAGSLPAAEVDLRLRSLLALPDPFDPRSVPGLFSEVMPPAAVAELSAIMADVRRAGTEPMARAFAAADLRPVLPRIDVPTLLLYGDADERAPRPVADGLHQGIPGSRLVLLPGLGHELYLESPTAFVAEVRPFLHSVP